MMPVFCHPATEACMHRECTVHCRADTGIKRSRLRLKIVLRLVTGQRLSESKNEKGANKLLRYEKHGAEEK